MKWAVVLFFIAGSNYAIASDFWSSEEAAGVTKGVPKIKISTIQQPKPVTLPAPGSDKYCMPAVADPKKMIDTMKSMFPGGHLPNPTEWQTFAERVGGADREIAPSVDHCHVGDWLSISDKYTALEYCDFDSTPPSAASFGICRYRGKIRQVRTEN